MPTTHGLEDILNSVTGDSGAATKPESPAIFENPLKMTSLAGWIGFGIVGAFLGYIGGDSLYGQGKWGAIIGFFGLILFLYLMASLTKVKK